MSGRERAESEPRAEELGTARWCAPCSRLVEERDAARGAGGAPCCPRCGGELDASSGDGDEPVKPPWHFKVLVVGTAGYLVYRLIWFIFWLFGHAWHG